MKTAKAWRLRMGDMQIWPGSRQQPPLKGPVWIIILVSLVSVLLICAYIYPLQNSATCYIFYSKGCPISDWLPPMPTRELSDQEIASHVVIRNILDTPPLTPKNPKIAFMFLTPGLLPFEMLWEKFFEGHEGKFSIYVHSSRNKPVHVSQYFLNRDIRSSQVVWGRISMVDAERRLLATALKDPDNQHFVLLSDSCIPLQKFDYVFNYLLYTNISFIDRNEFIGIEKQPCIQQDLQFSGSAPKPPQDFVDPGPHGNGRYIEQMLPEVEKKDFRKGAQWFSMKRQHALIIVADSLYYSKFRDYCKHGIDGQHCIADEHYFPTVFNMIDPNGIANWSVTYVDWSERKWHPRSFRLSDVNYGLMKKLRSIDVSVHLTSDNKKRETTTECIWNGINRPCYLFARKFHPETVDKLLPLFSNYTTF